MLKNMNRVIASVASMLILVTATWTQQPTAPTTRPGDDFVTEKGFTSKVFEIKFRDVDGLAKVLRPMGSGFKGASIVSNGEFRTLTVRDFPENVATMEDALKRLDTPAAPRPNIELHMYVLLASNSKTNPGVSAEVPNELKDVLGQLRQTLMFRNYDLTISVVQRLTETPRGLRGKGLAEIQTSPGGTSPLPYEYLINSVTLGSTSSGAPIIQIGEFSFSTGLTNKEIDNRAHVQTALNLRDGEKVVVGTAGFGDRALVVVLTAKIVS